MKQIGVVSGKERMEKMETKSPFMPAENLPARLKLFIWGESGTGKTPIALMFPKPVLIDIERGADHYGKLFKFDVVRPKNCTELLQDVEWLVKNKHNYLTVIIDSITVYWELLMSEWTHRFNKITSVEAKWKHKTDDKEWTDFIIRNWSPVKEEYRRVITNLMTLDMNVVVTAHSKDLYDGSGESIKKIGSTFSAEKDTNYMFDTVIRLIKAGDKTMAFVTRDRTRRLAAVGNPEGSTSILDNDLSMFKKAWADNLLKPVEMNPSL